MTDKNILKMYSMSDDAIIKKIGVFVRHHRLEQNITQKELAQKSGVNRTTISELELGRRCQLLTLIQVLRILNKLDAFQSFEIVQKISPIKLAEMEMRKRQKASRTKEIINFKKSDW
ncbi:MAG: helix-turn-helix transcriptional regulator [Crocinitomicaceae bacterium]|nr:helix-turn-helix transcriptional regulator [Crocinitomicaceae bacterium]